MGECIEAGCRHLFAYLARSAVTASWNVGEVFLRFLHFRWVTFLLGFFRFPFSFVCSSPGW